MRRGLSKTDTECRLKHTAGEFTYGPNVTIREGTSVLIALIAQLFHHQKMLQDRVALAFTQAQRLFAAGDKLGTGLRIARGEQSDLMALIDEFFRQE